MIFPIIIYFSLFVSNQIDCNADQTLRWCQHKDKNIMELSWGRLDTILTLENGSFLVFFNEKSFITVESIGPNGVAQVQLKEKRIKDTFEGMPDNQLIAAVYHFPNIYFPYFLIDKKGFARVYNRTFVYVKYGFSGFVHNFNIIDIREMKNIPCLGLDKRCVLIYYYHKPYTHRNINEHALTENYAQSFIKSNVEEEILAAHFYHVVAEPSHHKHFLYHFVRHGKNNYEFAKFQYRISRDDRLMELEPPQRISPWQPNQMILGCPVSFCLFSAIDAITRAGNDGVFIFSGAHYWRWVDRNEYPRVSDARLLDTHFQYCDAAFYVPLYEEIYIIKGKELMPFNNNHYVSSVSLEEKFPEDKVDAALYDNHRNVILLYHENYYWEFNDVEELHLVSSKNEFDEIPYPLDAVMTDYDKNVYYFKDNLVFWFDGTSVEYKLVQSFFGCTQEYYDQMEMNYSDFTKDMLRFMPKIRPKNYTLHIIILIILVLVSLLIISSIVALLWYFYGDPGNNSVISSFL